MGFLTDHMASVRRTLAEHPLDVEHLSAQAAARPAARRWEAALGAPGLGVIAEIKRSSPSAGAIGAAEAAPRAVRYEEGGAAAVSVVSEPIHFDGSLDDVASVSAAVSCPVLRKDFLLDASQVVQSRAAGADAVLVITAAVDDTQLAALLDAAAGLGMGVLLETHSDEDLVRALATGAVVVGVNARDLESLVVDVPAALERLGRIPSDQIAVMESGIQTSQDARAAEAAGASAILVGEALMRAPDPAGLIRELRGESGKESNR